MAGKNSTDEWLAYYCFRALLELDLTVKPSRLASVLEPLCDPFNRFVIRARAIILIENVLDSAKVHSLTRFTTSLILIIKLYLTELVFLSKKKFEAIILVMIDFIDCSHTKFVVIILVFWSFLCDFLLDRFLVWPIWLFDLKNGINRMRFTKTVLRRQFQCLLMRRAVLNLTPPPPLSILPLSNLLYLSIWTPLAFSFCNPTPIICPPPPRRTTHPDHPLMLAFPSPSWVLPKPTARRSFESNSPDVSQLCFKNSSLPIYRSWLEQSQNYYVAGLF